MERIVLGNTAFEGKNDVYLFDEDGETVLVDTGVATPSTRRELQDGLRSAGVTFADVDHVLVTHWHQDHAGLVGEIQAESDATVFVHEADAALVEHDEDALDALERRQRDCYEEWGMPAEKREELLAFFERNAGSRGEPATVERFADDDRIELGGRVFEVVHAPGHTAGLTCFVTDLDGDRVVLTGDAILPVYTPNVGGADVRVEAPLAKYLESLRRLADAEYDLALPGHRDPIDDPTERATAIMEHHEERAMRVLRVLDERGPSDVWSVSDALFGSLSNVHILHGPGEAYAHLEHLHRTGAVERDGRTYRRSEAASDWSGLALDEAKSR